MAKTLNDRILELENQIKQLQEKLNYVSSRTEEVRPSPYSQVPFINLKQGILPSTGTGLGQLPLHQGSIIFNDAENMRPPFRTQPRAPEKGYNKHSHSRYAGGALDIHTLELVEYVTSDPDIDDPIILDANGRALNKHCQGYWDVLPKIAKADDNITDKIGMLDIEFDTENKKWIAGGQIVIDETNFLQYDVDEEGTKIIKKDSEGNNMRAPINGKVEEETLYSLLRDNAVWDEEYQCWRFYAVYKE